METNSSCSKNIKSKCINDTYYWEPLSETWQSKLGSTDFMVKNCLGDGNCQFRSIETALTQGGYRATHEKLRRLLAKYILSIDNKVFIDIIKTYQGNNLLLYHRVLFAQYLPNPNITLFLQSYPSLTNSIFVTIYN